MRFLLPKNRSTRAWVILSVLLLAMGLTVWFGIIPFQRSITEKADSIQEYHALRENRERQISKLPELERQYEMIQADERMLHVLLSEDKIVDFIQVLEGLASETKTQVTIRATNKDAIEQKVAVKKKPSQDDSAKDDTKPTASILDSLPYTRYLHVTIVTVGEYRNIVSFLHKMETLPFGIDVVSLRVQPKSGDGQSGPQNSPGNNPFLIFGSGSVITGNSPAPSSDVSTTDVPANPIEASFETVIYLSK